MSGLTVKRRRGLFLAAAVVIMVWGSVGFYQGLHNGFSGGWYRAGHSLWPFAPSATF